MSAVLASAFVGTLDLAHRQIDKTNRHARIAEAILRRVPQSLRRAILVKILQLGTMRLRVDAIMFTGLAAQLHESRENCPVGYQTSDVNRSVITSLEAIGERVNQLHGSVLRLKTSSARLNAAAQDFAAAAACLYESVRDLRWELLELHATVSPISEGYAASSAEEFDAMFNRMLSD